MCINIFYTRCYFQNIWTNPELFRLVFSYTLITIFNNITIVNIQISNTIHLDTIISTYYNNLYKN